MLRKILLIISCFSILGCEETIDARQLEIDNGLFYKKGESDPFTGLVENFSASYRNGVRFSKITPKNIGSCRAQFKKGKLHGDFECFSDNDERVSIIKLENGKKEGQEAVWDSATGNLLYEVEFNNNAKHGKEITYDSTGENVIEKAIFSNGNVVSQKSWNSEGELTSNIIKSEKGLTGFNVNNAGNVNYYNSEKGIVVRIQFMFKDGYNKPEWSSKNRYFGNMEGAYVKIVNVESQKGYTKSYDYYDENGKLLSDEPPQYTTKFDLSDSYINSLRRENF